MKAIIALTLLSFALSGCATTPRPTQNHCPVAVIKVYQSHPNEPVPKPMKERKPHA